MLRWVSLQIQPYKADRGYYWSDHILADADYVLQSQPMRIIPERFLEPEAGGLDSLAFEISLVVE